MPAIDIYFLVLFLAIMVVMLVAVYASNRRSLANISFSFAILFICIWLASNQLSNFLSNYSLVLILNKLIFVASSLLSTALLLFSIIYPTSYKINKKWFYFIISISIIVSVFSLTNLIVRDIKILPDRSDIIFGPLIILYATHFFINILLTLYFLIVKFLKRPEIKSQIQYLFIGLLISVLIISITNIFFPVLLKNFSLTTYGAYSVIFFIALTSYSIVAKHLMDVRLILTETASIIVLIASLVQVFLSNTLLDRLINFSLFMFLLVGAYLVTKSVKHEITQRKQLAELANKLEKANEHLKSVDKLKDDFLSMASHELNTPIAAITGYLSMILQEGLGGKIPNKTREYLENIFRSSQRLSHMVKDLLNVSRIESGRIHLIYEQKPIEEIIEQSIVEVKSKAIEVKHTLEFEKPKKKIPLTWYDVTRITEILINILGNAIKYTDPGGKIIVRAMNDEGKIVVSVEDNGRGIPKDHQESVFEKFSQVDVLKDQVKGTGLGMYISKKFIELHKGKIWFHSDGAGKGTTFFFSLPIIAKKPYDPHEGEGEVLH